MPDLIASALYVAEKFDVNDLLRAGADKVAINTAAISEYNGIRVSPGFYSSKADMATLAVAIKDIANKQG